MGTLVRELEKEARTHGVAIKTSSPVKSINPEKDLVTVEFTNKEGREEKASAKFLLCGGNPECTRRTLRYNRSS